MTKYIKNEKQIDFPKAIACTALIASAGSGALATFAEIGFFRVRPVHYILFAIPLAMTLLFAGITAYLVSMEDDMTLDSAGLSENEGVILAQRRYARVRIGRKTRIIRKAPFVAYNDVRNTLVLMGEGTGKTQSVFLPTAFSWKGNLIAYDETGELWEKTGKHRSAFSKTVLFDLSSSECARYNFIDDLPIGKTSDGTKAFFYPFFWQNGDSYFMGKALDFLCAFVSFAVLATKIYQNADRNIPALLADLRRTHNTGQLSCLLVNMKNTRSFMEDLDEKRDGTTLSFIAAAADEMERNGEAFRENIIALIFSSLEVLESSAGAELACRSQFSLSDLYSKEEPVSIYLCFPEIEKYSGGDALCSALMGFFAWCIATDGKQAKNKTLFSLENVSFLGGKARKIVDAIPELNKVGAGILYGSKSYSMEMENWGGTFKEKIAPHFRTWVLSWTPTTMDKKFIEDDPVMSLADMESITVRESDVCYVADKTSGILYTAKQNRFDADSRFSAKGKGVKRWS